MPLVLYGITETYKLVFEMYIYFYLGERGDLLSHLLLIFSTRWCFRGLVRSLHPSGRVEPVASMIFILESVATYCLTYCLFFLPRWCFRGLVRSLHPSGRVEPVASMGSRRALIHASVTIASISLYTLIAPASPSALACSRRPWRVSTSFVIL